MNIKIIIFINYKAIIVTRNFYESIFFSFPFLVVRLLCLLLLFIIYHFDFSWRWTIWSSSRCNRTFACVFGLWRRCFWIFDFIQLLFCQTVFIEISTFWHIAWPIAIFRFLIEHLAQFASVASRSVAVYAYVEILTVVWIGISRMTEGYWLIYFLACKFENIYEDFF